MPDAFTVSVVIPAPPEIVYSAWLDADAHAAMTGGGAACDPEVGGAFSAWDDYIWGTNIELVPAKRILQAWRTSDFPDDAPDSRLELKLDRVGTGTRLTLNHSAIPEGQGPNYEQGWWDHYFEPMKAYFKRSIGSGPSRKAKAAMAAKAVSKKAAVKKAAAKKPVAKKAAARKPATKKAASKTPKKAVKKAAPKKAAKGKSKKKKK